MSSAQQQQQDQDRVDFFFFPLLLLCTLFHSFTDRFLLLLYVHAIASYE